MVCTQCQSYVRVQSNCSEWSTQFCKMKEKDLISHSTFSISFIVFFSALFLVSSRLLSSQALLYVREAPVALRAPDTRGPRAQPC